MPEVSAGEWIALAGLGVTVLIAIIAGVRHAIGTAYRFGQLATRLDGVEERVKSADANTSQLAVLTAAVGGIESRLTEMGQDVKSLLTGRTPVRRQREGD